MLLPLVAPVLAGPGYLRNPDIHGETVVFTAEDDLWTVSAQGGRATRLTGNVGMERMARFSPDGNTIAFTGEYDGNPDVYVIPATGGEPRRLTWHPGDDQVVGWSRDGARVYFRTRRAEPHGRWEMWAVPAAGGEPAPVPIGWSAWLDEDPQTGRLAFTRTGRESATWKRYRGGTADDIWGGDPAKGDYARLSNFDGLDGFPMWHGGKVYFLSDKGGTASIWVMDADGGNRKRMQDNRDWDVRWPSMGPDGRIVYMLGGDLWLLDTANGRSRKLEITVPGEGNRLRERHEAGAGSVESWDVTPEGDRLVLTVRGELWSVPTKQGGVSLPITQTDAAREAWPTFDSEGKRVVYVTDASGEQAIVSADAWGRGDVRTLVAAGETGWRFPPVASPDGKWLAWSDQTHALLVVPMAGGKVQTVDRSPQAEIYEYSWSRDGRWLAYVLTDRNDFQHIKVWDSRDGSTHAITGPTTSDHSPAWDPEGRYLYFVGDRNVNPLLGSRDFDYINGGGGRLYAVLLRPDVDDPFVPKDGLPSAEDTADDEKKKKKEKKKDKKARETEGEEAEDAPKPVDIVFDGLEQRTRAFDVPAGYYWQVVANADHVYWSAWQQRGLASDERDGPDPGVTVWSWSIADKEASVFADGVDSWTLAGKGTKLVFAKAGEFYAVDPGSAPAADALAKARVDRSAVVLNIDVRAEWRQMYFEAWRLMRDFHWEPSMGGIDWKAVRDRYATMLDRVASKSDFNDLLGEVIGELATSHTYVGGGDFGQGAEGMAPGMLGADVVREGNAWKISRIFHGDPADELEPPLLAPAAAVKEGEYILAVNHRAPVAGEPLEALLAGTAGQRVVLTVNGRASMDGAREAVVSPIGDDSQLRYADWVRRNREYVTEKSGGKLGYIHIPDMGGPGLVAFDTWFYPQLDREGMVIDCRWNRGGFVSQLILERLRRSVVSFDRSRGGGVYTYPARVLNGPFVVLTNEFAGSDGDIFPASVQATGIAPVIGKRSWGGVIGIRGDKPLVDGTWLTQPEYAFWWPKGGWVIENHGVDPDIEVDNRPQDVAAGVDPQLDRGIVEAMKLRESRPPLEPAFGPEPVKTRESFEAKEK